MERQILMIDGTTELINTTVTMNKMRELQKEKIVSKGMLNYMFFGVDEKNMGEFLEVVPEAVYAAYVVANGSDSMSKEEFYENLPYDPFGYIEIFGEVVGGPTLGKKFSDQFVKHTKKNDNQEEADQE